MPPAIFIKDGAQEYWSSHQKSKIWSNHPNQMLITNKIVCDEVVNLLLHSSIYNSGNNIIATVDFGICTMINAFNYYE